MCSLLRGVDGRSFDKTIYVKDFADDRGFWGVNNNRLETIGKSYRPWSLGI
jgi:hypothetical protein